MRVRQALKWLRICSVTGNLSCCADQLPNIKCRMKVASTKTMLTLTQAMTSSTQQHKPQWHGCGHA